MTITEPFILDLSVRPSGIVIDGHSSIYIYIYIFTCICIYMYTYIYIYICIVYIYIVRYVFVCFFARHIQAGSLAEELSSSTAEKHHT